MQQHYVQGSNGLSTKQLKMLVLIQRYREVFGHAPTVREIGRCLDIRSPSTVHHHLVVLGNGGYITKWEGQARTVVPTQKAKKLLWENSSAQAA
jgi:repressor LexA